MIRALFRAELAPLSAELAPLSARMDKLGGDAA
jgi:hypothetical protein